MLQDQKKKMAARAALEYLDPGSIIGVGTGSTTNHFIDALESRKNDVGGAVASSEATAGRLRRIGIPLLDLNEVDRLPVYFDGADEATRLKELIKGGGGALTREKIIAAASDLFVCMIDDSKLVDRLGGFPLPLEVLPMARRQVARQIQEMGARAVLREEFATDNGNCILDLYDLPLDEPCRLEEELNQLAGVVTNGLFCRRPADLLIVGGDNGPAKIE